MKFQLLGVDYDNVVKETHQSFVLKSLTVGVELLRSDEEGGKTSSQYFIKY